MPRQEHPHARWAVLTLAIAVTSQALAAQPPARTLGRVLADSRVDATGLPADVLAITVTEFGLDLGADSVVVAYYATPTRASAEGASLRVHRRENRTGAWRSAEIDEGEAGRTVAQVHQSGAWVVVDAERHGVRSTLVLDGGLSLRRRLDGSLLTVLADGVVLLREGTAADAPSRPALVSAYSPQRDEVNRIHPLKPYSPVRHRFVERVERSFASWGMRACLAAGHPCNADQVSGGIASDVVTTARGTRVAWVQRLGPPDGGKDGPVDYRVHAIVVCERAVGSVAATCRERAFGSYDGPDGEETRGVLESMLATPRFPDANSPR